MNRPLKPKIRLVLNRIDAWNYPCLICGYAPSATNPIEIHHARIIKGRRSDAIEDLIPICRLCHRDSPNPVAQRAVWAMTRIKLAAIRNEEFDEEWRRFWMQAYSRENLTLAQIAAAEKAEATRCARIERWANKLHRAIEETK